MGHKQTFLVNAAVETSVQCTRPLLRSGRRGIFGVTSDRPAMFAMRAADTRHLYFGCTGAGRTSYSYR